MNSASLLMRAITGHYRQHPWQIVLMWLGITLGVATVISIELLNDSARQSLTETHHSIGQTASHIIEGDSFQLEAFYRELEMNMAGVKATPVLITTVIQADTRSPLTVVGIDPFTIAKFAPPVGQQIQQSQSLLPLILNENTALLDQSTLNELKLDVGNSLLIEYDQKQLKLHIQASFKKAIARPDGYLIMDIGQAKHSFNKMNELSQIQLQLDDEQFEIVSKKMPETLYIEAANQKLTNLLQMRRSFELSLNALSGMALMMGLFLVYNSSHFAFLQRQPILAQLRAMGVTSYEIGITLFIEYIALAICAALSAIPVGWALASILLELMTSGHIEASNALPALSLNTILLALILGITGSLLACLMPLLMAPKTGARPFGDNISFSLPTPSESPWQLITAGLLLIFSGIILSVEGAMILFSYLGIAMMMFGCALLSPFLFRCFLKILSDGQKRFLPAHWLLQLTLRETSRNLSRTRIALMALMIAVATSYGMQLMVSSFRLSVEDWLSDRLNAPVYLRVQQGSSTSSFSLSRQIVSRLKEDADIKAIAEFSFRDSWIQDRKIEIIVSNFPEQAHSGYHLLKDNNISPWQQLANTRSVMISEPMAYHLKLDINDKITVRLDNQNAEFNIIAIFKDYGSEQGRMVISRNIHNAIWNEIPITAAGIYGTAKIESIATLFPEEIRENIQLIDQQALHERSLAIFDQTFAITSALQLVAVAVAFMGLFSSLLAILLERRKQMTTYHNLGVSGKERGYLLLGEGLLIGLTAGVIAIACGEWLAWTLLKVINLKAFGWNLPLTHSSWGWLQPCLLGITAALLATLYPAYKFSRAPENSPEK